MERHIHPVPNEIHEHFLFYSSEKSDSEAISQYVAMLKKLSEKCNFGNKINEHFRDRLLVGVRDEKNSTTTITQ